MIHALLGFVVIPPVLLKLGSGGFRFAWYYSGTSGYRAAGPPRPVMRALGPVTVVLTLVLFGSGVEQWLFGDGLGFAWVPVHHLSAYLWFVAVLAHVINYVRQAPRLAFADWRDRFPGRFSRQALVAGSLVLGIALAVAMLPFPTPFTLPTGAG